MTDGADASYIVDDICRRLSRRRGVYLAQIEEPLSAHSNYELACQPGPSGDLVRSGRQSLEQMARRGATLVSLDDLQLVDGATAPDRRRGPGGAVCMYEACIQRARAAAVADFRRGAVCP